MIEEVNGDLFSSPCEALVNPVNTVGVMGKGLAREFKRRFPQNFRAYRRACQQGRVQAGKLFVCSVSVNNERRLIVNFPTKEHWKSYSKLEYIQAGLRSLSAFVQTRHISSIAIPAIGCGEGGLTWSLVRAEIFEQLGKLPDVRILLYRPKESPIAQGSPRRVADK